MTAQATNTSNTSFTGASSSQLRIDAYARKLTAALTEQNGHLSHDFAERLRAARVQALGQRKRGEVGVRATELATAVSVVGGGALALRGLGQRPEAPMDLWQRIGSFMPLVGLVAGLWLVSNALDESGIEELAQVDAALLADDLPPSAYADPGFAQFLKTDR